MRKIVVTEFMSLDGVFEAPAPMGQNLNMKAGQ